MIFIIVICFLFISNHLLPFHQCLIFDKKSLPLDYIADGLKLQQGLVDKSRNPIKLYKSGSHYKPIKGYGKDYDYEPGESVDDEFEEEFFPSKSSSKDKDTEHNSWPNNQNKVPDLMSHKANLPVIDDNSLSGDNNEFTNGKSQSKLPPDSSNSHRHLPQLPSIKPSSMKQSSLTSDHPKDWRYQVCEEFLLRESGGSKIPKALRYHVDIDDHKRLNVNPPIDKKEMAKCLRNLAIIRGTDARLKGLDQLNTNNDNNNNKNTLSPNPFSSPSSSFIPASSPPGWSTMSSDGENGHHQSMLNLEANRARLISRLSEEQIRKLLLLLTEMLDKRMKPSPEIGKVPIHGKLTPLMYSTNALGLKSSGQRRRPLPPLSSNSGSKFPMLTPFSDSGNSVLDGGAGNVVNSISPIRYNSVFNSGFNSPSSMSLPSRGSRPFSGYSHSSSYGPLSSPPHSSYPSFHSSSYPIHSPIYPQNHHPATQVTRFPFTSPTGVKKLLVNEVLGVRKVEKYNGEREVEVGGGPKTVVVHEGELHVDPSGESSAIEIDENKMKQYRDNYLPGYNGLPRFSGLSGPMRLPGRSSFTDERYGPSFYDSFRDSEFPNDSPFPSFPESSPDSSSSSQTDSSSSSLPVSPPPIGRYHRDKHNHHRHQSYHHNNANEFVYSSDQGSTSHPSPGVQVTKCDESGTCTGPGVENEEESIKSKYKANNSATRAAYGRYGAKYLGLTLTSIANYAIGNLMGVLYSPFMKPRDTDKNGKVKPNGNKRPTSIPIGGRPMKGMFDPTSNGNKMNIKGVNSGPPGLDQEIENLLDNDYDDLEGDNKKARRKRRRRK